MDTERWLSVNEVVRQTGLSERTIRGLIAAGRLPIVRLHGVRAIRVPAGAVVALIGGPDAAGERREGDRDAAY